MAYHRQQGVDTAIVRIFNTYGPRMRANDGRAIPTFLRQALDGKPVTVFGDGSQTRSFCYVDDLIRGIILLVESNEHLRSTSAIPTRRRCSSSPRPSSGLPARRARSSSRRFPWTIRRCASPTSRARSRFSAGSPRSSSRTVSSGRSPRSATRQPSARPERRRLDGAAQRAERRLRRRGSGNRPRRALRRASSGEARRGRLRLRAGAHPVLPGRDRARQGGCSTSAAGRARSRGTSSTVTRCRAGRRSRRSREGCRARYRDRCSRTSRSRCRSRTRASTPWSPASSSSTCDSRMRSSRRRDAFFAQAALSSAPCRTRIASKAGCGSCAESARGRPDAPPHVLGAATSNAPRGLRDVGSSSSAAAIARLQPRLLARDLVFSGSRRSKQPNQSLRGLRGTNAAVSDLGLVDQCPSRST